MIFNRKRRTELPSIRHQELRFIGQLLSRSPCRIENYVIPFENHQLLGSRATNRFNKVVPGVEMADSGRDVEMKRKNIQQIALPRNGLAFRLEFESSEVCDGPIRSMFSGNPFWIVEGQGAGLDRDDFMSA